VAYCVFYVLYYEAPEGKCSKRHWKHVVTNTYLICTHLWVLTNYHLQKQPLSHNVANKVIRKDVLTTTGLVNCTWSKASGETCHTWYFNQINYHKTSTALWNPYRRVSSREWRVQIRFSRVACSEKPRNWPSAILVLRRKYTDFRAWLAHC